MTAKERFCPECERTMAYSSSTNLWICAHCMKIYRIKKDEHEWGFVFLIKEVENDRTALSNS